MLRKSMIGLSLTLAMLLAPLFAGCGPSPERTDVQPPAVQVDSGSDRKTEGIALLEDEADRTAAREQRVCPVSGEPLGSMGKPIKLTVEGREVFICCTGCEDTLREDPEKYFAKLDQGSPPLE